MTRRTKPKRPVVLQERDFELFTLIGLNRYIACAQAYFAGLFPTEDRARRRVGRLVEAGYLNITLAGSTRPRLVSLSRSGLRVVAEQAPELAERMRLPGTIRLAGIEHHLLVVDARIWAAQLEEYGWTLIHWSSGKDHYAEEIGMRPLGLEPDGLGVFERIGLDGEFVVAFEIDRATENRTVLGRKLRRYTAALQSAVVHELWLVLEGGKRRRATVEELATEAGIAHATRMVRAGHVRGRPVVGPARLRGGQG